MMAPLVGALMAAVAGGCATAPPPITKIVNGKVIVTRSVSPEAYEHVTRALLYEEEERWDDAATELQRALPLDDQAAEVRAHLAELFVRLGRLEDAAEQVEQSLRIEPTIDGWLASAHVREARGDRAGELDGLRHAVELADGGAAAVPARAAEAVVVDDGEDAEASERAHLALADAQIVALDIDGAYQTCRRLVQIAPDTIRGRVQLAALGWARGALDEADSALRGALEEEPSDIDARLLIAELQVARGQVAAAKASFREAIDRSDAAAEIAEAYAGWLVARGDRADAIELAERFSAEGGDADALLIAGRLERAAKRPDRAKALAAKALKQGAPAGRVALLIALASADEGQRDAAVATYLAVGKEAPEFVEAHLRAAELLRDDGKLDQAVRALDTAGGGSTPAGGAPAGAGGPTRGPRAAAGSGSGGATPTEEDGGAAIQIAIARSLIDEKRGDAAMAARRLDEPLAAHAGDARLLMARAGLEERRGDWRRALALAGRLLEREPRSVEALNFVGFVAADHGDDVARALKRLQAAAALNPGSGAILDSVGWAYFRTGDLARAGMFLEQSGRLEPGDPEILEHVGDLFAKRQDRAHALEAYRKALTLAPPERLIRELQDRVRTLEAKSAAER